MDLQFDTSSSGIFSLQLGSSDYTFKIKDIQFITRENNCITLKFYNHNRLEINIPGFGNDKDIMAKEVYRAIKRKISEQLDSEEVRQALLDKKEGLVLDDCESSE